MSSETGVGPYVQGDIGYSVQPRQTDTRDNSFVFGGEVGYDFGAVRTALNYSRIGQSNTGGGRIGGVDSDLISLEVYAEPITLFGFTPFVNAGIGYGFFSGTGVVNSNRVVSRQDVPVVNIGAGSSYTIDKEWDLVGAYRYNISTDDVVLQNDGTRDNYRSHVFTASVRYKFQ